MQISIKVRHGDSVQQAVLTPHPGRERELSTPLRIWHDMRTTPAVQGCELRRWRVLNRLRERYSGLAEDEGPRLKDGDEVTFVVSRPGH